MKKTTKIIVASVTVFVILAIAITTTLCVVLINPTGKMGNKMYEAYTDLAKDAKYSNNGKNMSSFKIKGKEAQKNGITVDLGKVTKFNTIQLEESTKGVTMFSIFASNDEKMETFELIYEGDTIENFRICYVGDVEYRYLRIDVVESSANYKVNDIKVYYNKNEEAKKRVASYFLIDRIFDTDLEAINTATELIIFSWMRFDKDGNIKLLIEPSYKVHLAEKLGITYDPNTDPHKDDAFLPDDEAKRIFTYNLNCLKTKVAEIESTQNRKINLIPTILMPWSDDPNDANKYARAIQENADKTAKNVKAFIDEFGFDGVDFDYEYPYSNKEHKLFDNFLITVDKEIGDDKILSTALGAWNIKMSKDAIAVVDQFQLMTYDIFDSHGYHAAFHSCMIADLHKAIKKGIPAERINLGLPFYSRPISRAGYWGDYFKLVDLESPTGKYQNIVRSFNTRDSANYPLNEPEYFNGYQMIQDKTAFAVDTNVGGVMIWHMNCDIKYSEKLSLFRAINTTILEKGASLVTNK